MDFLTEIALKYPWLPLTISGYLLLVKILTGIKDSVDKTPGKDTNIFERIVTILGKTVAYLTIGQRPQAPPEVVAAVGVLANAAGVKAGEIVDATVKIELDSK